MIGSFVTRSLALVLGYAYPAYECFKTVELNKPDIELLLFWCQYWILVAVVTVFERVGDNFISWLPMYGEAKLAFLVYLWCPKTKGTTYVYETFFKPYVSKHENEIDHNLLELRTRAGDFAILYFQRIASYGQARFFEILQYVASQSQSPSQSSRARPLQRTPQKSPPQQMPPKQIRRTISLAAAQEPGEQIKQRKPSSSSPSVKAGGASSEAVARQIPSPSSQPNSETTTSTLEKEEPCPPVQETPIEEAIRVTRARLRKRAATTGPAGR
ncbi:HVA22-like protein g [Canna indica]|uniref:HVA22-like protein n=1 Tax=Canna indica TaxID=4628 RepID=A0AAQ3KJ83_9LILI|nr:HVA22-like protein g [Canna indica]